MVGSDERFTFYHIYTIHNRGCRPCYLFGSVVRDSVGWLAYFFFRSFFLRSFLFLLSCRSANTIEFRWQAAKVRSNSVSQERLFLFFSASGFFFFAYDINPFGRRRRRRREENRSHTRLHNCGDIVAVGQKDR